MKWFSRFCHPDFIMRTTQFLNDPLYVNNIYLNNAGQLRVGRGISILMLLKPPV